ncbi:MAG: thioredoxin [Deltaproteobacteria bacterium]|nr:thioredoxin [Deltaproteobacteria bacterium]
MTKTVKLTEANFETQGLGQNGKPILIDFWASWCGPCRAMEPVLESLATELEGQAVIAKVNVDEEPALANGARIQSIPTMLLLKDGQVKEVFVGVTSKSALRAALVKHMQAGSGTTAVQAASLASAGAVPH